MNERSQINVHPNSTAARKWGRKTWTSSSYFVAAAAAEKRGDREAARALRHAGARRSTNDIHCG